jgi:hypothetical protein
MSVDSRMRGNDTSGLGHIIGLSHDVPRATHDVIRDMGGEARATFLVSGLRLCEAPRPCRFSPR